MATGFKELVLIPALMEPGPMDVGLTRSEANAVIIAVFGSIKDALLRHESVELPIGTFTVVQNPEKRRAWKFGQVTVLYAHRYQVKFLPSAKLNLAAVAAPPSPPRPKRKKEILKSELTISAELIVEFVRKNVQEGNWTLFFKELSDTGGPFVPAEFKRTRPKPHELRPLDEAAQVIEKCAPEEMPDDSWEHLYACLEWFARWTQRVIPKAVWKEAMEQAKKILLPQDLFRTVDGR
jgi:nucleoid DNA-binding protein